MAENIPVEQEIVELLHTINRQVRADSAKGLEPLGLTPAQARALRVLHRGNGRTRMAELADRLHIVRRSATSVVDELTALHLVARCDDPRDRRGVLVELTERGVAVVADVEALRRDAALRLVGRIPREQRTQLRDLLRTIHVGPPSA